MVTLAKPSTTQQSLESAEKFGEYINRYGFMIIFSAVILVIMIIVAIFYIKKYAERSKAEMEMANRERTASIEQNSKMFDLVTKVQTEQVVQLQAMTESLRTMNTAVHETERKLESVTDNFAMIRESMLDCSTNHERIQSGLRQVLDSMHECHTENREIMEKLNSMELDLMRTILKEESKEETNRE